MKRALYEVARGGLLFLILIGSAALFRPATFPERVWLMVFVSGVLAVVLWAWRRR